MENVQNIVAYALVATSVFFLIRKFFFKKNAKACGKDGSNCKCG